MMMANTAISPPIVRLPVSPMNTCAGKALYHKKPTKGSNEGTDKDYQFLTSWNIHDIQVFCIFYVTGYVGQYS